MGIMTIHRNCMRKSTMLTGARVWWSVGLSFASGLHCQFLFRSVSSGAAIMWPEIFTRTVSLRLLGGSLWNDRQRTLQKFFTKDRSDTFNTGRNDRSGTVGAVKSHRTINRHTRHRKQRVRRLVVAFSVRSDDINFTQNWKESSSIQLPYES